MTERDAEVGHVTESEGGVVLEIGIERREADGVDQEREEITEVDQERGSDRLRGTGGDLVQEMPESAHDREKGKEAIRAREDVLDLEKGRGGDRYPERKRIAGKVVLGKEIKANLTVQTLFFLLLSHTMPVLS